VEKSNKTLLDIYYGNINSELMFSKSGRENKKSEQRIIELRKEIKQILGEEGVEKLNALDSILGDMLMLEMMQLIDW
jgi:hypothetical protein